MKRKPGVSVILPAYNEGLSLFRNVALTVEVLQSFLESFEVVVVDDGSTDDTVAEAYRAAAAMPEVRVISYSPNRGKGYAVLTGARAAVGAFVAFIDADLDIHPRHLAVAMKTQQELDAHVVIGSKWHPESAFHFPFFRRVISLAYYLVVRVLFGLPVRDTQTGIKLYSRELVQRLVDKVNTSGYSFDLEMLVLAHRWGYRIQDIPVEVQSTRTPRIRLRDVLHVGLDTLQLFFRLRRQVGLSEPSRIQEEASSMSVRAGR